MTAETQILQYLNSLHPALNFSLLHVKQITRLMQAIPSNGAFVKLYRYNGQRNDYDPFRTIPTDNETIKQAILTALESSQPKGGYMYECYNSDGEKEGKIYSLNPELF